MKKLSVIIPTLNNERSIAATLEHTKLPGVECIVADGGSDDQTVKIAERLGARIIHSPTGRGRQMNAGAAQAEAKTLLFLRPDTLPPERYPSIVKVTLNQPKTIAGAFSLKLDETNLRLRLIELGYNLRAIFLQLPSGNQSLFLRTHVFEEMGGFPEVPILEDYLFVRRLRHYGTIRTTVSAAITSARRWQEFGILRATLVKQVIITGLHLHISPDKLADFYRLAKSSARSRRRTPASHTK